MIVTSRKGEGRESSPLKVPNHSLLSKKETYSLLNIYRDETQSNETRIKARNKIVEHNMKFAFKVASVIHSNHRNIPLYDLYSASIHGMIFAFERMDIEKVIRDNESFITYAVWWMRVYVNEHIKKNESGIRYPENKVKKMHKAYKDTFEKTKKMSPGEATVEWEAFKIKYGEMQDHISMPSIDETIAASSVENSTMKDTVVFKDRKTLPNLDFSKNKIIDCLYKAISSLEDDRDKKLVVSYFGIQGETTTLKDLAEEFDMPVEKVQQRKNKVVEMLSKNKDLRNSIKSLGYSTSDVFSLGSVSDTSFTLDSIFAES